MNRSTATPSLDTIGSPQLRSSGYTRGVLLVIVGVAALLRFSYLGLGPPGLNQDEAANAWNAYCLLKTGVDQVGQPWPIFYTRGLGENRSTLFIYLLMPIQALFGLSPFSTRLLAPLCGTLCIPLMYVLGAAWFDRRIGLIAAAALAIHPWHIQHSRWGHESSIVPFLVLLPIATAIWAGLPVSGRRSSGGRASGGGGMLAGLFAGVACYGYPCVRLFLPVFVLVMILATWRGWAESWRTTNGRRATLAAMAGFCVTFAPLAILHLVDSEINKRGVMTRVWRSGDGVWERCGKVLERYAMHYDPAFLFFRGDAWEVFSPPGGGMFHWTALPLMIAGLAALVMQMPRWRIAGLANRVSGDATASGPGDESDTPRSRSVRESRSGAILLLFFLLAYPAGDLLSGHPSAHALRSLPGVIPLNLLVALGAVAAWDFLKSIARPFAWFAAATVLLGAAFETTLDQWRRLTEFNERPRVYHDFYVDLLAACDFLHPRFDTYDVLFFDDTGMPYPYVVLLTGLGYDPQRWRDEPRDWEAGGWDVYRRFGRVYMLSDPESQVELARMRAAGLSRAAILARPGAVDHVRVLLEIKRPDGKVVMWVCEPIPYER